MKNHFLKEKAQIVCVHDPEKRGPEQFPGALMVVFFPSDNTVRNQGQATESQVGAIKTNRGSFPLLPQPLLLDQTSLMRVKEQSSENLPRFFGLPTWQESKSSLISTHFNFSYKWHTDWLLSQPPQMKGSQFQRTSESMAPALESMALLKEREGQRYLESKQACCESWEAAAGGLVTQMARDQKDPGQAPNCTSTITDGATSRRSVSWPTLYSPRFQPWVASYCPRHLRNWREVIRGRITDMAADGG